jgi:hypothetical protein
MIFRRDLHGKRILKMGFLRGQYKEAMAIHEEKNKNKFNE